MAKGIGSSIVINGLTVGGKTSDATIRAPESGESSTPQANCGTWVMTDDGRRYRYVRANEALPIGNTVTHLLDVTTTNASAAASDNTFSDTSAFTADRYAVAEEEWYIGTNGDTGAGQIRRILSNTVTVLTLDNAWTTAIATDTDAEVFSPYRVELTDAEEERVCGVVITAITSQYYGWIQDQGFCPLVTVAGNTDAVVPHEGLVSSSGVGVAKGLENAATTADEADKSFGYAYQNYAVAAAAGTGVAACLKC